MHYPKRKGQPLTALVLTDTPQEPKKAQLTFCVCTVTSSFPGETLKVVCWKHVKSVGDDVDIWSNLCQGPT